MNKIKILICDDHTVMRQGTCKLFEQEPDFKVVGEAGDGEEAVKLATELMPDIVLMDIAMPKMDGIAATRKIVSELLTESEEIVEIREGKRRKIGIIRHGS